jgi:hypothetical protein
MRKRGEALRLQALTKSFTAKDAKDAKEEKKPHREGR